MSVLIDGRIPPKTECPYKNKCPFVNGCYHKGVDHKISFSCASARAFEMMESRGGIK